MKITRHKTVIVPYAIVTNKGSFGGMNVNGGTTSYISQVIDLGIEDALAQLDGMYMTNTAMIKGMSATPLELGDGSVFLAITVIATLEPNKMKDMRFNQ